MPRAEIKAIDSTGMCPSCGGSGSTRLHLVTEKGRVAWDGCAFCLQLAQRRNQEEVLRMLCREADKEQKQQVNIKALR